MVRQHHSVDRCGLGKNTESNGQWKPVEKDDPCCGQPSALRMTEVESSNWLRCLDVGLLITLLLVFV